jgi:RNA polymerase-binding protein DksA
MTAKKLTKKQLTEYEKILLTMRQKAMDDADSIKENSLHDSGNLDSTARDSNYAYHMADVGTDSQEREKSFLWYTRENKYIRHIDEALGRIKDGTFGLCKTCGELIPHARLKEVPNTTQCVGCKNQDQ